MTERLYAPEQYIAPQHYPPARVDTSYDHLEIAQALQQLERHSPQQLRLLITGATQGEYAIPVDSAPYDTIDARGCLVPRA